MNRNTKLLISAILFLLLVSFIGWQAIQYLALPIPFGPQSEFAEQSREQVPAVATRDNVTDGEQSTVSIKLERFISGLEVPWSIVFTSSSRIIVSERKGTIRLIENGTLVETPLYTFSQVRAQGEEGLMGLALDPDYVTNKFVYACYSYPSNGKYIDRVVRLTDEGDSLTNEKTILEPIPAAQVHAGCRIKFGPDKKLYLTAGDATEKNLAQDITSLAGKILRINADGTIPADNPFPNSYVYSIGHRNPQGIDWHPLTKKLYETEHGPSGFDGPGGGDEVNMIEAGRNYGWPLVSHDKQQDGLVDPLRVFTPAVAPASGTFYRSKTIPQFTNSFFFGGLRGEGLFQVKIDDTDPKKVLNVIKLPEVKLGRIRDVVEGPDGFLYFSTSNKDGRGKARDGDDAIYRLLPE